MEGQWFDIFITSLGNPDSRSMLLLSWVMLMLNNNHDAIFHIVQSVQYSLDSRAKSSIPAAL